MKGVITMTKSLKEIYENRRSVNNFDPTKGLSNELLKKIIDQAVLAPSGFNLQPWRIIAVESQESKEKLLGLANNQPKIMEAPVTLILVGDKAGYEASNPAWAELESMVGKEGTDGAKGAAAFLYGSSEERKIKFAESNTGLLAMSIMYAAEFHGVHSHAMSGIDFSGIKEGFGLAAEEEVVMLIALGYHDDSKELYPRRKRRGYDEIVTVL